MKSFVSLHKKYDDDVQCYDASNKFVNDEENKIVYEDDEFTKFIFALGVSLYFKLPAKKKKLSFWFGLETWKDKKSTSSS